MITKGDDWQLRMTCGCIIKSIVMRNKKITECVWKSNAFANNKCRGELFTTSQPDMYGKQERIGNDYSGTAK